MRLIDAELFLTININHDCDSCMFHDECDEEAPLKCTEFELMMREALEKQIPIKAEYHAPDFDTRMFGWWTCGNCGCEIASICDKYCSCCGKRIDWSEVE